MNGDIKREKERRTAGESARQHLSRVPNRHSSCVATWLAGGRSEPATLPHPSEGTSKKRGEDASERNPVAREEGRKAWSRNKRNKSSR